MTVRSFYLLGCILVYAKAIHNLSRDIIKSSDDSIQSSDDNHVQNADISVKEKKGTKNIHINTHINTDISLLDREGSKNLEWNDNGRARHLYFSSSRGGSTSLGGDYLKDTSRNILDTSKNILGTDGAMSFMQTNSAAFVGGSNILIGRLKNYEGINFQEAGWDKELKQNAEYEIKALKESHNIKKIIPHDVNDYLHKDAFLAKANFNGTPISVKDKSTLMREMNLHDNFFRDTVTKASFLSVEKGQKTRMLELEYPENKQLFANQFTQRTEDFESTLAELEAVNKEEFIGGAPVPPPSSSPNNNDQQLSGASGADMTRSPVSVKFKMELASYIRDIMEPLLYERVGTFYPKSEGFDELDKTKRVTIVKDNGIQVGERFRYKRGKGEDYKSATPGVMSYEIYGDGRENMNMTRSTEYKGIGIYMESYGIPYTTEESYGIPTDLNKKKSGTITEDEEKLQKLEKIRESDKKAAEDEGRLVKDALKERAGQDFSLRSTLDEDKPYRIIIEGSQAWPIPFAAPPNSKSSVREFYNWETPKLREVRTDHGKERITFEEYQDDPIAISFKESKAPAPDDMKLDEVGIWKDKSPYYSDKQDLVFDLKQDFNTDKADSNHKLDKNIYQYNVRNENVEKNDDENGGDRKFTGERRDSVSLLQYQRDVEHKRSELMFLYQFNLKQNSSGKFGIHEHSLKVWRAKNTFGNGISERGRGLKSLMQSGERASLFNKSVNKGVPTTEKLDINRKPIPRKVRVRIQEYNKILKQKVNALGQKLRNEIQEKRNKEWKSDQKVEAYFNETIADLTSKGGEGSEKQIAAHERAYQAFREDDGKGKNFFEVNRSKRKLYGLPPRPRKVLNIKIRTPQDLREFFVYDEEKDDIMDDEDMMDSINDAEPEQIDKRKAKVSSNVDLLVEIVKYSLLKTDLQLQDTKSRMTLNEIKQQSPKPGSAKASGKRSPDSKWQEGGKEEEGGEENLNESQTNWLESTADWIALDYKRRASKKFENLYLCSKMWCLRGPDGGDMPIATSKGVTREASKYAGECNIPLPQIVTGDDKRAEITWGDVETITYRDVQEVTASDRQGLKKREKRNNNSPYINLDEEEEPEGSPRRTPGNHIITFEVPIVASDYTWKRETAKEKEERRKHEPSVGIAINQPEIATGPEIDIGKLFQHETDSREVKKQRMINHSISYYVDFYFPSEMPDPNDNQELKKPKPPYLAMQIRRVTEKEEGKGKKQVEVLGEHTEFEVSEEFAEIDQVKGSTNGSGTSNSGTAAGKDLSKGADEKIPPLKRKKSDDKTIESSIFLKLDQDVWDPHIYVSKKNSKQLDARGLERFFADFSQSVHLRPFHQESLSEQGVLMGKFTPEEQQRALNFASKNICSSHVLISDILGCMEAKVGSEDAPDAGACTEQFAQSTGTIGTYVPGNLGGLLPAEKFPSLKEYREDVQSDDLLNAFEKKYEDGFEYFRVRIEDEGDSFNVKELYSNVAKYALCKEAHESDTEWSKQEVQQYAEEENRVSRATDLGDITSVARSFVQLNQSPESFLNVETSPRSEARKKKRRQARNPQKNTAEQDKDVNGFRNFLADLKRNTERLNTVVRLAEATREFETTLQRIPFVGEGGSVDEITAEGINKEQWFEENYPLTEASDYPPITATKIENGLETTKAMVEHEGSTRTRSAIGNIPPFPLIDPYLEVDPKSLKVGHPKLKEPVWKETFDQLKRWRGSLKIEKQRELRKYELQSAEKYLSRTAHNLSPTMRAVIKYLSATLNTFTNRNDIGCNPITYNDCDTFSDNVDGNWQEETFMRKDGFQSNEAKANYGGNYAEPKIVDIESKQSIGKRLIQLQRGSLKDIQVAWDYIVSFKPISSKTEAQCIELFQSLDKLDNTKPLEKRRKWVKEFREPKAKEETDEKDYKEFAEEREKILKESSVLWRLCDLVYGPEPDMPSDKRNFKYISNHKRRRLKRFYGIVRFRLDPGSLPVKYGGLGYRGVESSTTSTRSYNSVSYEVSFAYWRDPPEKSNISSKNVKSEGGKTYGNLLGNSVPLVPEGDKVSHHLVSASFGAPILNSGLITFDADSYLMSLFGPRGIIRKTEIPVKEMSNLRKDYEDTRERAQSVLSGAVSSPPIKQTNINAGFVQLRDSTHQTNIAPQQRRSNRNHLELEQEKALLEIEQVDSQNVFSENAFNSLSQNAFLEEHMNSDSLWRNWAESAHKGLTRSLSRFVSDESLNEFDAAFYRRHTDDGLTPQERAKQMELQRKIEMDIERQGISVKWLEERKLATRILTQNVIPNYIFYPESVWSVNQGTIPEDYRALLNSVFDRNLYEIPLDSILTPAKIKPFMYANIGGTLRKGSVQYGANLDTGYNNNVETDQDRVSLISRLGRGLSGSTSQSVFAQADADNVVPMDGVNIVKLNNNEDKLVIDRIFGPRNQYVKKERTTVRTPAYRTLFQKILSRKKLSEDAKKTYKKEVEIDEELWDEVTQKKIVDRGYTKSGVLDQQKASEIKAIWKERNEVKQKEKMDREKKLIDTVDWRDRHTVVYQVTIPKSHQGKMVPTPIALLAFMRNIEMGTLDYHVLTYESQGRNEMDAKMLFDYSSRHDDDEDENQEDNASAAADEDENRNTSVLQGEPLFTPGVIEHPIYNRKGQLPIFRGLFSQKSNFQNVINNRVATEAREKVYRQRHHTSSRTTTEGLEALLNKPDHPNKYDHTTKAVLLGDDYSELKSNQVFELLFEKQHAAEESYAEKHGHLTDYVEKQVRAELTKNMEKSVEEARRVILKNRVDRNEWMKDKQRLLDLKEKATAWIKNLKVTFVSRTGNEELAKEIRREKRNIQYDILHNGKFSDDSGLKKSTPSKKSDKGRKDAYRCKECSEEEDFEITSTIYLDDLESTIFDPDAGILVDSQAVRQEVLQESQPYLRGQKFKNKKGPDALVLRFRFSHDPMLKQIRYDVYVDQRKITWQAMEKIIERKDLRTGILEYGNSSRRDQIRDIHRDKLMKRIEVHRGPNSQVKKLLYEKELITSLRLISTDIVTWQPVVKGRRSSNVALHNEQKEPKSPDYYVTLTSAPGQISYRKKALKETEYNHVKHNEIKFLDDSDDNMNEPEPDETRRAKFPFANKKTRKFREPQEIFLVDEALYEANPFNKAMQKGDKNVTGVTTATNGETVYMVDGEFPLYRNMDYSQERLWDFLFVALRGEDYYWEDTFSPAFSSQKQGEKNWYRDGLDEHGNKYVAPKVLPRQRPPKGKNDVPWQEPPLVFKPGRNHLDAAQKSVRFDIRYQLHWKKVIVVEELESSQDADGWADYYKNAAGKRNLLNRHGNPSYIQNYIDNICMDRGHSSENPFPQPPRGKIGDPLNFRKFYWRNADYYDIDRAIEDVNAELDPEKFADVHGINPRQETEEWEGWDANNKKEQVIREVVEKKKPKLLFDKLKRFSLFDFYFDGEIHKNPLDMFVRKMSYNLIYENLGVSVPPTLPIIKTQVNDKNAFLNFKIVQPPIITALNTPLEKNFVKYPSHNGDCTCSLDFSAEEVGSGVLMFANGDSNEKGHSFSSLLNSMVKFTIGVVPELEEVRDPLLNASTSVKKVKTQTDNASKKPSSIQINPAEPVESFMETRKPSRIELTKSNPSNPFSTSESHRPSTIKSTPKSSVVNIGDTPAPLRGLVAGRNNIMEKVSLDTTTTMDKSLKNTFLEDKSANDANNIKVEQDSFLEDNSDSEIENVETPPFLLGNYKVKTDRVYFPAVFNPYILQAEGLMYALTAGFRASVPPPFYSHRLQEAAAGLRDFQKAIKEEARRIKTANAYKANQQNKYSEDKAVTNDDLTKAKGNEKAIAVITRTKHEQDLRNSDTYLISYHPDALVGPLNLFLKKLVKIRMLTIWTPQIRMIYTMRLANTAPVIGGGQQATTNNLIRPPSGGVSPSVVEAADVLVDAEVIKKFPMATYHAFVVFSQLQGSTMSENPFTSAHLFVDMNYSLDLFKLIQKDLPNRINTATAAETAVSMVKMFWALAEKVEDTARKAYKHLTDKLDIILDMVDGIEINEYGPESMQKAYNDKVYSKSVKDDLQKLVINNEGTEETYYMYDFFKRHEQQKKGSSEEGSDEDSDDADGGLQYYYDVLGNDGKANNGGKGNSEGTINDNREVLQEKVETLLRIGGAVAQKQKNDYETKNLKEQIKRMHQSRHYAETLQNHGLQLYHGDDKTQKSITIPGLGSMTLTIYSSPDFIDQETYLSYFDMAGFSWVRSLINLFNKDKTKKKEKDAMDSLNGPPIPTPEDDDGPTTGGVASGLGEGSGI